MLAHLVVTAAVAAGCPSAPPPAAAVPAPLVLRTGCGTFRVARSGAVTRLPPRWVARHSGGTGRRFGADLQVRRTRPGRYLLLRDGRPVWRSHGRDPNDAGWVAFGRGVFAFASHRRGVFVTDLRGAERRVAGGTGLFPIGFTRDGFLFVARRSAVDVVTPDGRLARRLRYRTRNGFAYDERSDTLFLVARDGTLVSTDGKRVTRLRRVRTDGWLSVHGRVLVLEARRAVLVTSRDGAVVARTGWRRGLESDSGVSVAPGGRAYALRLRDEATRTVRVVVLRPGERPAVVARRRLGPRLCVVAAAMAWSGRFLLYRSTAGDLAVLDSRGGPARSLLPLARRLGLRTGQAEAWWASDLGG